jgi:hypothetical protein
VDLAAALLSLSGMLLEQGSLLDSWTLSTAPVPQSKHSYGPHLAQNRPTPLPTVYKATRRPQPPTAVSFHSHTTTLPSPDTQNHPMIHSRGERRNPRFWLLKEEEMNASDLNPILPLFPHKLASLNIPDLTLPLRWIQEHQSKDPMSSGASSLTPSCRSVSQKRNRPCRPSPRS